MNYLNRNNCSHLYLDHENVFLIKFWKLFQCIKKWKFDDKTVIYSAVSTDNISIDNLPCCLVGSIPLGNNG